MYTTSRRSVKAISPKVKKMRSERISSHLQKVSERRRSVVSQRRKGKGSKSPKRSRGSQNEETKSPIRRQSEPKFDDRWGFRCVNHTDVATMDNLERDDDIVTFLITRREGGGRAIYCNLKDTVIHLLKDAYKKALRDDEAIVVLKLNQNIYLSIDLARNLYQTIMLGDKGDKNCRVFGFYEYFDDEDGNNVYYKAIRGAWGKDEVKRLLNNRDWKLMLNSN